MISNRFVEFQMFKYICNSYIFNSIHYDNLSFSHILCFSSSWSGALKILYFHSITSTQFECSIFLLQILIKILKNKNSLSIVMIFFY
jgi:hypothetical protein